MRLLGGGFGRRAEMDSMVAQRERLDKTVWADEVLAQEYEEPFVTLWDRLRGAEVFATGSRPRRYIDARLPTAPELHFVWVAAGVWLVVPWLRLWRQCQHQRSSPGVTAQLKWRPRPA